MNTSKPTFWKSRNAVCETVLRIRDIALESQCKFEAHVTNAWQGHGKWHGGDPDPSPGGLKSRPLERLIGERVLLIQNISFHSHCEFEARDTFPQAGYMNLAKSKQICRIRASRDIDLSKSSEDSEHAPRFIVWILGRCQDLLCPVSETTPTTKGTQLRFITL